MAIDWGYIQQGRALDSWREYAEDLEERLKRANETIYYCHCLVAGMAATIHFLKRSVEDSGDSHGLLKKTDGIHDKGSRKGQSKIVLDLVYEKGYMNKYEELSQDKSKLKYLTKIKDEIYDYNIYKK